jgi:hypothetical protein
MKIKKKNFIFKVSNFYMRFRYLELRILTLFLGFFSPKITIRLAVTLSV